MIIFSLRVKLYPEKQSEALDLIRPILGPTCVQPGCISIAFYKDTDDSSILLLLEEWEDWSSLEDHIRSDSYRNILALMDLSSKQPEIKMNHVSKSRGIEWIEMVRGSRSIAVS